MGVGAARHERDVGVELMRVAGCLIVIGCHLNLPAVVDGVAVPSRVLMQCLFADGVAVFWLITGFFMFGEGLDYQRTLSRGLRRVALPALVFLVLEFYFNGTAVNGEGLAESASHAPLDYVQFLRSLLTLNVPVAGSGHLWYVFAYLLVLTVSPVLNAFVLWLRESRRREDGFLAASLAAFALNTMTLNATLEFSHHALGALAPAATIVVWGDVFWRRWQSREVRRPLRVAAGCAVGFLAMNAVRAWVQWRCYQLESPSNTPIVWFTPFGIGGGLLVGAFCLSLGGAIPTGGALDAMVRWLGSYTFPVYVTHQLVINVLAARGVLSRIEAAVDASVPALRAPVYVAASATLVFLLSLAACTCLRALVRAASAAVRRP